MSLRKNVYIKKYYLELKLHSDKEAYFRTKMTSKISGSLIPSTFVVVVQL